MKTIQAEPALNPRARRLLFAIIGAVLLMVGAALAFSTFRSRVVARQPAFDAERAFEDLAYQMSLGPRLPGSEAHSRTVTYISKVLEETGWETEAQRTQYDGRALVNVIGRRPVPDAPRIVLGAHYDSRLLAEKDPQAALRSQPVPGANDGASGVAVLLELARALPEDLNQEIWLVFFDAEDNGNIPGWDWILGSRAFVEALDEKPDAAVIVDMVGDADLNIHLEGNSDPVLSAQIWAQAAALGHGDVFLPTPKYTILDDHVPFLQAGIPAVDIIDFDYPYHHTTEDTLDKVSSESLAAVGETLLSWILEQNRAMPE